MIEESKSGALKITSPNNQINMSGFELPTNVSEEDYGKISSQMDVIPYSETDNSYMAEMARKAQENPQLDMTPMIDVVFELIIFFVVTLVEAQKKDETIELEDGRHGIVLVPEELPPTHMQIDIGVRNGKSRISMGDIELTPSEVTKRVRNRMKKFKIKNFPVLIRADFQVPHKAVAQVMDACAEAGIWQVSFMAVAEDKTKERKRLKRYKKH
jgi:biopolymer transport protein ExbD